MPTDYDAATFGVLSGTMTVEEQLSMFTETNNNEDNEAPRLVSCEDRVEGKCNKDNFFVIDLLYSHNLASPKVLSILLSL